jgi:hypothetical protein
MSIALSQTTTNITVSVFQTNDTPTNVGANIRQLNIPFWSTWNHIITPTLTVQLATNLTAQTISAQFNGDPTANSGCSGPYNVYF